MFTVNAEAPTRCESCGRALDVEGDAVIWMRIDRGVAIGWCSDKCVLKTVQGELLKDWAGNAFVGLLETAKRRRKG